MKRAPAIRQEARKRGPFVCSDECDKSVLPVGMSCQQGCSVPPGDASRVVGDDGGAFVAA